MKLDDILRECQRRIATGDTTDYVNPFESLAASRPLQKCQRERCGKLFRPKRPSQLYCDASCQVGNWNDKQHALAVVVKAEQAAKALASQGREQAGTKQPKGEQFV